VTSLFGESVLRRWYRNRNWIGSDTSHTEVESAEDLYVTVCTTIYTVYNRRVVHKQGPWTIEDTEACSTCLDSRELISFV
jgi:hypothetical protein